MTEAKTRLIVTQINEQINEQIERSRDVAAWLLAAPGRPAMVLNAIREALEARKDELLAAASAETALTVAELGPEFARIVGTLGYFAKVSQGHGWMRPVVDLKADVAIGPGHDVRRTLVPLGDVVGVLGASNFPLAYGVLGGDTASAIAAGCAVVVKEHPAHPALGAMLASIARTAVHAAGAPADVLGYLPNPDPQDRAVVTALVQHEAIAAIGFTGSTTAGLAIDRLARERASGPIPTFCEMGSVNPLIVTASALAARGDAIAQAVADSVLLRFGQQCTRPGLIFVESCDAAESLLRALADRVRVTPGREMLAPWVRDSFDRRVEQLAAVPGVRVAARGEAGPGARGAGAVLFETNADVLASSHTVRDEIFGPATMVVRSPVLQGPASIDAYFPTGVRSLTWTLTHEATDLNAAWMPELVARMTRRAGRVVFNGVPTGVRVCDAMVHGGPFPATNRPDSTAVGVMAMERWCRPVCYQNAPGRILPPALRT
jgi:2,5-dioxopentanoate dehydrogenase